MRFPFFYLAYLLPALALAGGLTTYRDESGTLHAVASPEDIPEKYRARSKALAGSGESGSGEANIKLVKVRNSLLINVSFGAAGTYPMILDTGASISMISKKVAEKLRLQPVDFVTINSASNSTRMPVVEVPETSVAQFTVRALKMVVNDLPGHSEAQGLLGVDFLNHFKMELDTATGQLHLKQKSR